MDSSSFSSELIAYYVKIKQNKWYWWFSIFCRISLAYAFIVAGMVKILGERFASGLSILHPMGAYLEALHHTGYYYTFIGIAQVTAGILLLIPQTVTLGALIYFPIILNIWILSYAVRFEGSDVTSPLMTLAVLYLLAWNYDKLKYIIPSNKEAQQVTIRRPKKYETKFPFLFFGLVSMTVVVVVLFALFGYEVRPRNSISDCQSQFINTANETAGFAFCECIHRNGNPLDECLKEFEKVKK